MMIISMIVSFLREYYGECIVGLIITMIGILLAEIITKGSLTKPFLIRYFAVFVPIIVFAILLKNPNFFPTPTPPADDPAITATPVPAQITATVQQVTFTPKPTATFTPKPTATFTPEPTVTFTPEPTATFTPEPTATFTPEPTKSLTRALPSSPYRDEIPDSWEEIIAAIDDGTAQQRYAVGAYKPLDLGQFGTVNMQLAGFNLDERADGQGKAATTWIAKEILSETHRWNPMWDDNKEGTGTIGGWGKCELRRWMNERVLSAIPKDVRDRLISVKKSQYCCDTNLNWIQQTTEDSVWIPSYDEVFGDQSLYYGLFRNQSDRRVKTRDGSAAWWWLRSATSHNYYAYYVASDGSYDYYIVYNTSGGLALGFCLGEDAQTALQDGEISDSWDEIIAAIDDGTAQQRYAVGAYKPLDLGQFGTVNMQLAGFNLDERADGKGKASTTWIAKEILSETHRWNPSWDNNKEGTGTICGWAKCELRQWMNERVRPAIPKNVRDRLVPVKKTQEWCDENRNWIQQTTEDSVWIPSYDEVFGDQSLYYGLFRDQDDRRVKTRDGSAAWWWLRSADYYYGAGVVFDSGYADIYTVYNTSGGVVLGFCL